MKHFHGLIESLLPGEDDLLKQADISFAAPTKEWVTSLTHPTINCFLFDMRENTERREVNPQFRDIKDKTSGRRMPPRRIDLGYLVSVFAADVLDEHALLWRVVTTLMKFPELPLESLPKEIKELEVPVCGRLSDKDSGRDFVEWWNGFGIPPRLALHYILTVPLDLSASQEPVQLVEKLPELILKPLKPLVRVEGVVRYRDGKPAAGVKVTLTTDKNRIKDALSSTIDPMPQETGPETGVSCVTGKIGKFVFQNVPQREVKLTIQRKNNVTTEHILKVPSGQYEIILDDLGDE